MKSFLGNTSLTRGLSNNNPLNLVYSSGNDWKGKIPLALNSDGKFEQFESVEYGIRAAMIVLKNYYVKYGLNTVYEIVNRFSPVSDGNNVNTYANMVIGKMGGDQLPYLDKDVMIKLVKSMAAVEIGNEVTYISNDSWNEAFTLAFPAGLNIVATEKKKESFNLMWLLIPLVLFLFK